MRASIRFVTMMLIASAAWVSSAHAAPSYPSRPVRFIVPFAPGGPTDAMARLLGTRLTELWGQQVIVDNRPGASASIGIALAAKAEPDGHTLLMTTHAIVVNPSLYHNLAWDPVRDFVPITNAATAPNLVIAHPSLAAKTLKDLIGLVKANPGKFVCGTPGTATSSHLAMERLRVSTGIDLQHVPYAGAGPVVNAVIGNQVPMAVVSQAGPATRMIQAGRIRALATTGSRRSPSLPDVPTLRESELDFVAESMNGLFTAAHTPAAIVDRIHNDVVKIVHTADMRERLAAIGFEPLGNPRDEFTKYVKSEIAQWSKVIREAGIKPQ